MANSAYADASQRLPWLTDSSPRPQAKDRAPIAPLFVSLILVLAIGLAAWSILAPSERQPPSAMPSETVALPPPAEIETGVVETPLVPEPTTLTPAPRPAPQPSASSPAKPSPSPRARRPARRIAEPGVPASEASPYDARAWRSGIPGRIIQLGAFRSSAQAQDEWQRVYMQYPLLRPLSPRVIKSRIRGRTYYRLQLGTASQAHSELLCQRLRTLGEGCIVLGLPNRG